MGFTTGFTGGVTLILGAAYLSLQSHQLNRQRQAETLRAQTYILNSLSYIPASAPPPKTIAEELALLEHQQELLAKIQHRRAQRTGEAGSVLDRAKERWNAEVESAVRWASNKDWVAAREDAEDILSRVWARATGGEPPSRTAERAGAAVSETAACAATAARSTAEQTASRTKEVVQTKAVEAKEAGSSIWERGLKKGQEVASQAKAAVGLAEQKVQQKATELVSVVDTDVEKVIQQRFERKPEDVLKRSPEEVLEARYKPVV